MAFLDDIINNLHREDAEDKDKEKDKEKDKDNAEEQEQGKEKKKKRDSLITYSDKFYEAFEK